MVTTKEKVFLVTGAYGFLGSKLMPLLLKEFPKTKIFVIGRGSKEGSWGNSPNSELIGGDLRDTDLWKKLPENITHVFYLAASIPWKQEEKNKASVVTENILPIANLIERSGQWRDLEQIIFSSSVSVYGRTNDLVKEASPKKPLDIYGASKLAAEQLLLCLESRGIIVTLLRYGSLYGQGQYQGTVIPTMINKALNDREIFVFGDGTRSQDFIRGEDAANANILAYLNRASGAFNIGFGSSTTMKELAGVISEVFTNGKAKIIYKSDEKGDAPGFRIDISKARKELGFSPEFQLKSGLEKLKSEMNTNN